MKLVKFVTTLTLALASTPVLAGQWGISIEENKLLTKSIESGELTSIVVPMIRSSYGGHMEYAYGRKVIEGAEGDVKISVDGCSLQAGSSITILGMVPDIDSPNSDFQNVLVRYHESSTYEDGVGKFDCGDNELLLVHVIYIHTLLEKSQEWEASTSGVIPKIQEILRAQ